jgi:exopolyphosphatase/guanosine-5'-triphosphate,3'-diphosphate pyrophosphatase
LNAEPDSLTSPPSSGSTASPAGPELRPQRIAAIDVGSNSIRLSVAEYDPGRGLRIIDEFKDQPRLAAGVTATGKLDDIAIARAIDTLKRMRDMAERRGVTRIRAVATSAVREAENRKQFVHRVKREVGLDLEVIDPELEASLSYRSVAHHFSLHNSRALIADIGGGSLELIGAVSGLVELTTSLPLGTVRLNTRWLSDNRPAHKQVADLRKWVRKRLKRAFDRSQWRNAMLIGSGGTFTNLGRMVRGRRGHPVDQPVHGEEVRTGEVEQLLELLSTLTPTERAEIPGLNPQRTDIILAGLAVTAELMDLVEARSVTVSAFGLREGLLLEMVGDDTALASDPLRAMREFVDRCQIDRPHVEHVRVLALTLFDRLRDHLGADPSERFLLEAAALLHDVGQVVAYRRHHKHSYDLILHAERLSLTARDRAMVALISRYHRKSGPSKKHPEFARLSDPDQAVVRRLSGILRIADGLDRGHSSHVERVTTRLMKDHLSIKASPRTPGTNLTLEIWGANRKSDVLAKVLERRVVVDANPPRRDER